MRLKISTTRRRATLCLLALVAPALVVHASHAYLPITGPTPLRFEVAFVKPVMAVPAATPEVKAGEVNPPATGMPDTNALSKPGAEITPPAAETTSERPAATEVELSGPVQDRPPDNNLLIITPQILAEYFRPATGTTNGVGTAVFLPVSVGFTPPTEKAPVSSRATYKTE